jgi:hypothetical protein
MLGIGDSISVHQLLIDGSADHISACISIGCPRESLLKQEVVTKRLDADELSVPRISLRPIKGYNEISYTIWK